MDKIEYTIFKKNRFYVRLKPIGIEKGLLYPRAIYVWLKYNPSFKGIPKGYVIHHLDLDPTNDDPSNLVLMHKFHHTAYHSKYKEIITDVLIDNNLDMQSFLIAPDYPRRRPKAYRRGDRDTWFLYCVMGDGKERHISRLSKRHKMFQTKEEAESAIDKLWPQGWNGTTGGEQ